MSLKIKQVHVVQDFKIRQDFEGDDLNKIKICQLSVAWQSPKPHPKSLSEGEGLKKKVSPFAGDLEGANCRVAPLFIMTKLCTTEGRL